MTSQELRQKYLDFFVKKGHRVIPPSPLVLENDPTTLFTSSGMQPLIPYLSGQPYPSGSKKLVNTQPSFRSQDIDEVGDNRHTTFFEMLGNWSLGNYFKKDQLTWLWEFLVQELNLPQKNLYVTVFKGNSQVPKDTESEEIWKSLGLPKSHIFVYGTEKNWWSRSGSPENMPPGEIGGSDSEIFFEFTQVGHNPKYGEKCHPNCDCGRFLEIGNSVFIQYQKQADGSLKELPQKNVDFGGGLERLVAATKNEPDIFKTDLFSPIIKAFEPHSDSIKYGEDAIYTRNIRIIIDHLRASVFLIKSGVVPSNKLQGYILRRLIRRATIKMVQTSNIQPGLQPLIAQDIIDTYAGTDYFSYNDKKSIPLIIEEEIQRFGKTLDKGVDIIRKTQSMDGKAAFDLFQTYGFPWELTVELAKEKGQIVNKEEFEQEFHKHRELSRTASAGMFKGGLADHSEQVTKYHTATHLLHAALRQILGTHVQQKGSNLTNERIRFDFSHPEKLTEKQIKEVEDVVNQQIQAKLPVTSEVMRKEEALKSGALGFFAEKYGDKVIVFTIGHPDNHPERAERVEGLPFSREICAGPHIENTGSLGQFNITKEESAGSGIRRIYATLS